MQDQWRNETARAGYALDGAGCIGRRPNFTSRWAQSRKWTPATAYALRLFTAPARKAEDTTGLRFRLGYVADSEAKLNSGRVSPWQQMSALGKGVALASRRGSLLLPGRPERSWSKARKKRLSELRRGISGEIWIA
jgi:hypothetical protein